MKWVSNGLPTGDSQILEFCQQLIILLNRPGTSLISERHQLQKKSFIKVIKRRGPKMLLCRTPREMPRQSEIVPFTGTACFLIHKYELNQPSVVFLKPWISNFLRRRSWLIRSKALLTSSIRNPLISPLSILRSSVSVVSITAVTQEWFFKYADLHWFSIKF